MLSRRWVPPTTGDQVLDRAFTELADRVLEIGARVDSAVSPAARLVTASAIIIDETFLEYRGAGLDTVILPPAASRGVGRGAAVVIHNSALAVITVRAVGQEKINGLATLELAAGAMAYISSNGRDAWKALVPSSGGASSAGGEPWLQFKHYGQWIPAGVILDGGANDVAWAESEDSATTASFNTHLIAYPEVAPAACTIDGLGFYMEGPGNSTFTGICRNTQVSGNHWPGTVVGIFEDTGGHGFDGDKFRSGSPSNTISLAAGERFWQIYQCSNTGGIRGYRLSKTYRNVFGNTVASPLSSHPAGQIGLYVTTAGSYDSTITSFPTSGVSYLKMGNNPIGAAGANTVRVPSVYYKLAAA